MQMNKLQFIIIIFSALLISYNCVPDFMIPSDVNSYYVDFDSNRQSVLTMSEQDAPNNSFRASDQFDPFFFSSNDRVAEFQLEADIPEKSDGSNYNLMLITSSEFESTSIIATHNPAIGVFHFPSEAYRLRI
jgi:hypothetical protein